MLYVVDEVIGLTYLDKIMYVICKKSSTIRLYNTDTLSPLDVVIDVTGVRHPTTIVVCRHDRQLYIADYFLQRESIWRVSVDDHSYVKWMIPQFGLRRLWSTSRHLFMTSWEPPTVRQYNTTNKQLLCVVPLPQDVGYVRYTTHGTFVVGHRDTSQDKRQCVVSEMLRFCHVLQHYYHTVMNAVKSVA